MGFTENYLALERKRKKKEEEQKKTGHSFTDNYLALERKRQEEKTVEDIAPVFVNKTAALYGVEREIAPTTAKKDERKWFEKGAFEDGYQLGDISKTILGTGTDIKENLFAGVLGVGEAAVDFGAWLVGSAGDLLGADKFTEKTDAFIAKDLYDERKIAKKLVDVSASGVFNETVGIDTGDSVLGERADNVAYSIGQQAVVLGLQALGVPWQAAQGVIAFGSEAENALNNGAGHWQAGLSGGVSAGLTIGTGALFGGSGLGEKGLINLDSVTKGIKNDVVRTLAAYGVDMVGESAEEVIEGVASALAQQKIYAGDKAFSELFSKEDFWDAVISAGVSSGVFNLPKVATSLPNKNSPGKDYRTGLTPNEQKVFDKVYADEVADAEKNGNLTKKEKAAIYDKVMRDMDRGYISTDTIEEVLDGESYSAFKGEYDAFFGGETYKAYKDTLASEEAQIKEIEAQIKELEEAPNTVGNSKKYDALQSQIEEIKNSAKKSELKAQLDSEAARIGGIRNQLRTKVSEMVKDSKLYESYRELARKNEKFTADVSKYTNEHARQTIQNIMDSGVADNTNEFHEFADWLAQISADKGITFTTTDTERLKGTRYYHEGYITNGFVDENGNVTLNMDSAKAGQVTVGHEITHVLKGTEFYGELEKAIKNYAVTKMGQDAFNAMLEETKARYKGKGDPDEELTADLVGDYLFTDEDFVRKLSVQHRNVFQKIYDEIKYLCKIATAGSKEARELEKVKRAFEKAYKESGKSVEGVKHSISEQRSGVDILIEQARTSLHILEENGVMHKEWAKKKHAELTQELDALLVKKYGVSGRHKQLLDALQAKQEALEDAMFSQNQDQAVIERLEQEYADAETALGNFAKEHLSEDDFLDDAILPWEDTKYSLSDSDGKQLTKEQQEYFKDSKVRDENGNLLKVYHGSKNSGFNVFKYSEDVQTGTDYGEAYYFTSDRQKASGYSYDVTKDERVAQYKKEKDALRDKFLQTRSEEDKNALLNYKLDGKSLYDLMGDESYLTEGGEVKEVYLNLTNPLIADAGGKYYYEVYPEYFEQARANGNDGIIVKNVIDNPRGEARPIDTYIAFKQEQIKNTTNTKPTADADIRFSLSEPVEKTDRLVAVHNKSVSGVMRMLERNGVPFPSVAIKKSGASHEGFGECSVVFPRSTIDPEANRWNKLYSNDAWTPTEPRTEYDVGDTYKYKKLFENMLGTDIYNALKGSSYLDGDELAKEIGSSKGDVFDAVKRLGVVKYGYLQSIGQRPETGTKQKTLDGFGRYKNDQLLAVFDAVDGEAIRNASYDDTEILQQIADALNKQFVEQIPADKKASVFKMFDKKPLYTADNINIYSIKDAYEAWEAAGRTIPAEIDYYSLENALRSNRAIEEDADYQRWVEGIFDGVIKDSGIPNGKDYYTPSGNRRSFKALHVPATLENIVQQMRKENETGVGALGDINLRGAATKTYDTVEDMRKDSNKLLGTHIDDEVYNSYMNGFHERLHEMSSRAAKGDGWQSKSTAEEILLEAVRDAKTKASMNTKLRKEADWINYDAALVEDLWQLKQDVQNMPAPYFEAKPRRIVSPYEAAAYIIPDNAPAKLFEGLNSKGLPYKTYKAGDEADRLRVLNGLLEEQPDLRFSLSEIGETPDNHGLAPLNKFRYYGKDMKLVDFSNPEADTNAEPNAPVADAEMFADDLAPIADDPERFDSLTDADAPVAESATKSQRTKLDEPETKKKSARAELHESIVDNIKARFKEKGFDFDKVLRRAKNLSTFSTVDNTPQRVMEKALGYKAGQVLSDLTVNKVAQNETEGIKWLNSFTDRKSGLLKQLSDRYNIKPGSKESAAAQMYAEGFYVDENNDIISYGDAELAKDFPDTRVQANIKGLASDPRIRQIYDDTLAMINESRTRNAYPEIQKLANYFLHFRAMDDTFSKLGLPFNPNDIRAKDLPTDLNGVTADLKPGQPYFASAMHRTGKRTSFDLLGGLEKYLTSAKNQIYHIDDIQTLRALRNHIADTYGQANGLEGLDSLSEEEAQDRIEKVYNSHLSTFAKFLNEEANILAGKTALIDRGLEGIIGRRGITFLNTVNGQVGSNMVGYNLSSALTNFLPVAQTFAKSNKADFVKAFAQTVASKTGSLYGKTDSFAENSPVMIRRKGADRFHRTAWQKVSDPGYALMGAVDSISTELIARTKYNELIRNGMDSQTAHYETDKWVSRLMGDRSLGQMPQIYNSKMLGLVTKFQLEVRNQLDSQFYDTIQEAKVSNEHIEDTLARNARTAAKVASTFVQLAVVQHLFGKAFESVAGYNPAFDIIEVLLTAFGFDDEEDSEDTALDNIEQGFLALLEDLPYTSTLTGGRIPIASALPVTELIKGEDEWGNEKSRWETLGEIAPYYALPGGYGQAKKTIQGLGMFSDEHPIAGSYTDSGNLRFPVEDTLGSRIKAGIFGQYASENARDYFDNERSPLKEKQIQEFIDLDIPIRDYWEYREGLSGLSKLSEKADYIAGLDLPIDKKNLLINNIADREEDIDLTGYEDFDSFDEFDFAVNNPEKYEIAEKVGGYEAYMKYQEGMKGMKLEEKVDYVAGLNLTTAQKNALINGETDRKEPIDLTGYENYSSLEEMDYAKEHPENYAVAKAVGGYDAYRTYSGELYDIKADKDSSGKSISGSRKEKVYDYINGLDIEYGEKLILFKNEYNADDTYNYEIIDYLNSREDISYDETVTILKKLGFTVDSQGNIYW